jgi:DNA-directed RNA polymerase specialized sigma24 family protein
VKNGVSTVTLDDLIAAALTGLPYNQQRLGTQARLYSRRLSKTYGTEFPEDLHEEVFGQAFVELFQTGPAALAHRSGKALFRRAVLAAIRSVRASYTPPGRRTRAAPQEIGEFVAAEDVGRIATKRDIERCSVENGDGRSIDFDRFSDPGAAAVQQQIQDRLEVEGVLRHAPAEVGRALRLIYLDDEPVEIVAAELNISRFALHRRITAFCMSWRAAA